MPFVGGLAAALASFALLAFIWPGFAASGGGLIIGAVAGHAVGSAVACFLQRTRRRNLRTAARIVVTAAIVACVLALSIVMAFVVLAYTAPRSFASATVLLVASLLIGIALAAVVARWLEPTWNRTAGPLGLVVLALLATYILIVSRLNAGVGGGANVPPP